MFLIIAVILASAAGFVGSVFLIEGGSPAIGTIFLILCIFVFIAALVCLGGLKVLTANKPGMDANALRQMGDFLRDKEPAVVAVLASVNDDKITFLAVCGKDAVAKGIKAGDLVKQVCTCCGGSGGGKPDSAMGGGKDISKIDDALASVDDFIASKLG